MLRQMVSIDVWRGKAYLPRKARLETGLWIDLEPVYVVDLSPEGLRSAIEKVLAAGHPRLPDMTREELRKCERPILNATKARSWKELARTGASYLISWTDERIKVGMSHVDKKRRGEYDPAKVRVFPLDTPLEEIVAVILEDIQSRPEVWQ